MEQKKPKTEEKTMQTEIDSIEQKNPIFFANYKYRISRMIANNVWSRITYIYTVDHAIDLKKIFSFITSILFIYS